MVFDAHERAFRLFGGACRRGIYDNMTTAVDAVFLGKERRFNRRFLPMCSHYLVEPVACTPAAGPRRPWACAPSKADQRPSR
jgi:transposase